MTNVNKLQGKSAGPKHATMPAVAPSTPPSRLSTPKRPPSSPSVACVDWSPHQSPPPREPWWRRREENLEDEDDLCSLLSEWAELDDVKHDEDEDEDDHDNNDPVMSATMPAPAPTPRSAGGKKKWRRRLHWRPPSVRPPRSPTVAADGPRPPPGNHVVIAPPRASSSASIATFLSGASSGVTPRHSNQALAAYSAGQARSLLPSIGSWRPRDRDNAGPLSGTAATAQMEMSAAVDKNAPQLGEEEDRRAGMGLGNTGDADDMTHVTFENLKISVTKNYDCAPTTENSAKGDCNSDDGMTRVFSRLDEEAEHIVHATCATGADILIDLGISLGSEVASPTSVAVLESPGSGWWKGGSAIVGDGDTQSSLWDAVIGASCSGDTAAVAGGKDMSSVQDEEGEGNEEGTVSTVETSTRRPGPIDVDTCQPPVAANNTAVVVDRPPRPDDAQERRRRCVATRAERRRLSAMHTLGTTHLVHGEHSQALATFREVLLGQVARHGPVSPQAAAAMHRLGSVCRVTGQHAKAVKLHRGAGKLWRTWRGDDEGVAACLGGAGDAHAETGEWEAALTCYQEALRIRRKVQESAVGRRRRQRIARLLTGIGCALCETGRLAEARRAFEDALRTQRERMRAGHTGCAGEKLAGVVQREARRASLGVALALTNLGAVHLCLGDLAVSLACLDEAALVSYSCDMSAYQWR